MKKVAMVLMVLVLVFGCAVCADEYADGLRLYDCVEYGDKVYFVVSFFDELANKSQTAITDADGVALLDSWGCLCSVYAIDCDGVYGVEFRWNGGALEVMDSDGSVLAVGWA